MSTVLVLLCSLFEGMIYFHPSKCYFFTYFFHPLYSSSFYVTLPRSSDLSPFRRLYWLLIIFATLSVPTVSVWRQSCCSQTQKMGLLCVPGFSLTGSNRAALEWHSDRAGIGHYQDFVLCSSSFMHPDAMLTLATYSPDGNGLTDTLCGATSGKERCTFY